MRMRDDGAPKDAPRRRLQKAQEAQNKPAISDEQLRAVLVLLGANFSLRACARLLRGVCYSTLWVRLSTHTQQIQEATSRATRHCELEQILLDTAVAHEQRLQQALEQPQQQLMLLLELGASVRAQAGEQAPPDRQDTRLEGCYKLTKHLGEQVTELTEVLRSETRHQQDAQNAWSSLRSAEGAGYQEADDLSCDGGNLALDGERSQTGPDEKQGTERLQLEQEEHRLPATVALLAQVSDSPVTSPRLADETDDKCRKGSGDQSETEGIITVVSAERSTNSCSVNHADGPERPLGPTKNTATAVMPGFRRRPPLDGEPVTSVSPASKRPKTTSGLLFAIAEQPPSENTGVHPG